MLVYKLNKEGHPLDGRIFFFLPDGQAYLIATPVLGGHHYSKWDVEHYQSKGVMQELDLLQEKKIHHHLYKPIKELVEQALKSV